MHSRPAGCQRSERGARRRRRKAERAAARLVAGAVGPGAAQLGARLRRVQRAREQQVQQALADAGRPVHRDDQRPRGPLRGRMVAHRIAQLPHGQVLPDQLAQQVGFHALARARRKLARPCAAARYLSRPAGARRQRRAARRRTGAEDGDDCRDSGRGAPAEERGERHVALHACGVCHRGPGAGSHGRRPDQLQTRAALVPCPVGASRT